MSITSPTNEIGILVFSVDFVLHSIVTSPKHSFFEGQIMHTGLKIYVEILRSNPVEIPEIKISFLLRGSYFEGQILQTRL